MSPVTPDTHAPPLDILDPGFWRTNPHHTWTWLRANDPVHRDAETGLWAITRHADVLDVERRSNVFSSERTYRLRESIEETNMIASDDPRHQQQRRLVNRSFTPRAVHDRTAEIQELVDELLDPVTAAGGMEVVDAVAAPLPCRLTCRLFGMPDDEWRTIKAWSEKLMRIDSVERDPEAMMAMIDAGQSLYAYVLAERPHRRECPGEDVFSTWCTATIDGEELTDGTVFHEFGLFVAGGAETTRTAIAHGLRTFCDHPDQWELLAERPELAPSAVDEVIRWVSPLNQMFRKATVDTEVGGTAIGAGERLMLVYPSANRDEAVFDDPFRFDITRSPNHHLAFGNGTHFCLGANLARHELAILLTSMAQRWTNLRVTDELDVEPNIFARAARSLGLAFDVR